MSRLDAPALLPPIPAKRYFTIGEVSELTQVKPHVLRYWEQEFTQLKPLKRRGNRRYYQHHEVLLVRRIRELLYEQGFTISGARNRLDTDGSAIANGNGNGNAVAVSVAVPLTFKKLSNQTIAASKPSLVSADTLRTELESILAILHG
jgi:DNA-binding transcriptional MerR regulator